MKTCPKCSHIFDPGKWDKKYCSRKCANSRVFSDETNIKRSLSNSRAHANMSDEKKRSAIQKRLQSIRLKVPKYVCLDCGKKIRQKNKHKRCQECYYKSDDCYISLSHYKNYQRKTVIDSLGNNVFLMSSLEIKYHDWLVSNNIPWKKATSIRYIDSTQKSHWYRPDFHLIDSDEIIEIKGYFWNNDRIKMQWVIEQNPELKIKILTKKDLKFIGA